MKIRAMTSLKFDITKVREKVDETKNISVCLFNIWIQFIILQVQQNDSASRASK